jgi:hypothetical protein
MHCIIRARHHRVIRRLWTAYCLLLPEIPSLPRSAFCSGLRCEIAARAEPEPPRANARKNKASVRAALDGYRQARARPPRPMDAFKGGIIPPNIWRSAVTGTGRTRPANSRCGRRLRRGWLRPDSSQLAIAPLFDSWSERAEFIYKSLKYILIKIFHNIPYANNPIFPLNSSAFVP